ncbi:MAG: MaoC family dehydratase [Anaerolineae bacterium]|nr:MaoC family dehydratase [Anaerolineae bacterium]
MQLSYKEKTMIKVGDSASLTKTFSDQDVRSFAEMSGDKNPVHLDDEFAAQTQFKKRLVHGILTAGLISAVLGTELPGPGSIYLSQSINFRAPVFIGDTITATATVVKMREGKPIVTLETVCKNQDEVVVLKGEAVLLVP